VRSWASREQTRLDAHPHRGLIRALRERVKALFDQTLDVIEDAMKARSSLW